jgi:hypothetical protein
MSKTKPEWDLISERGKILIAYDLIREEIRRRDYAKTKPTLKQLIDDLCKNKQS